MASSAKLVLGLAALFTFAASASSSGHVEQLSATPEWDLSFIESLKSPSAQHPSNITKPQVSLIETGSAISPGNDEKDADDEALDIASDPATPPKFLSLESQAPAAPASGGASNSLEALSAAMKEGAQDSARRNSPSSGKSTAAMMEAELMNLLLGKSAFGATPMGGSVKKIHNILTKEMMPKVKDAHKSDQNELNQLMKELKNCFTVRDRALRSAAPWSGKYKKQSSLHKNCRSDEAVKYSSKEACLKQQRALYEVKVLKCNYYAAKSTQFGSSFNNKAIVTKAGSERVQSYITRISGTICGKHVHGERGLKKEGGGWGGGLLGGMLDQYLKAKFACEVATKNYNNKVAECKRKIHEYNVRKGKCNQFQTLMDSRSCKFAVLTKDTCEQYAGCYSNRRKAYEVARAKVKMEERDRKAEWRGLERIACLIAAFADGQVSDKEVDECKKKTVGTAHLIIKYHKIPEMTKCIVTKLYPATGAYKRKEFAPLPTLAKGKVSIPCSGVEEIPTKPRKGSPKTCKCRRVTLEGHYRAGPMIKCTGCLDVRRSKDKNSCPVGTKIFAPSTRNDWRTFLTSAKPLGQPHWIIDVTRPQDGCGGCTSNPMNSLNQNQKSWRTSDRSPWWLRSTKYSEPNGDYSANCYLGLGKKKPPTQDSITFNDKGCSYHSKAYYCQKRRLWLPPKKGSPKSCKCQPVTMASRYSTKLLVKCEECLTVSRSLEKNSCPRGTKLFSPRSRADWKAFIISAAPLRAPHWIIDITRPQNGCGGCTKYAMNSNVPQQATWRTADKSPWWLRSNRYNQPNGDYRANCYMDLFRRPTSESAVQFRAAKPLKDGQYAHKGCSYSSRSYYCQPKMHPSKVKKEKPKAPPARRLVPNSILKPGLMQEVYYFKQGTRVPRLKSRLSNALGVSPRGGKQGGIIFHSAPRWSKFGISTKKDFAVRWSGMLISPKDGKYRFWLNSADGSNLYIDNKKVINNDGVRKNRRAKQATRTLKRGQYRVRVEYFDKVKKGSAANFDFQVKQVGKRVPRRYKYFKPLGDSRAVLKIKYPVPAGFKEEIFYSGVKGLKIPDLNAKKADVQRVVPRVTYGATKGNWRGFTRKDNFAVRWSGLLQITKPGPYKFSVRSNDGSKLFVNRRLLVNNDGVRHGMVNVEGTKTMSIRTYRLILEYFEKGANAGMLLRYMGPDTNAKMIPVGSKIDGAIVLRAQIGKTKTPVMKKLKKLKKKAPQAKLGGR